MNMAIAFFVGCLTFVAVMIIKIPIKRMTAKVADGLTIESDQEYILYKRLNVSIMIITMLMAMISYYWTMQLLGLEHIKWCCSIKAGAIAIAMHAVYELLLE